MLNSESTPLACLYCSSVACLYHPSMACPHTTVFGSFLKFYGQQNGIQGEIAKFKAVENNGAYSNSFGINSKTMEETFR